MASRLVKRRRSPGIALAVILLSPLLDDCAMDRTDSDAPSPGAATVSIVGTPFLFAFKIPVCAATLAAGAPLAALTELADPHRFYPHIIRAELDQAVTQNCGPPWILRP
jgi:hypothetical protein